MSSRRALPSVVEAVVVLVAVTLTALAGVAPAAAARAATARPATVPTRGTWDVRAQAPGRWLLRWTSPTRLPVQSDRPLIRSLGAGGGSVGVSTTESDGRTVHAVVVSSSRPAASDFAVQLSGRRLDRPPATRRSVAAAPATHAPAAMRRLLATSDPGEPGPYATVTSDYTRPSVAVPGTAQPIEMVGHVVEPAADAPTGPRPLVLFLHGRHGYCYQVGGGRPNDDWPCRGPMREVPSQLGYDYVQRLLASQGFATVSIRVNGINAQDYALPDGGAQARAIIVRRHLDYWATIASAHQVDMGEVVLVGHSRGGEGVDRASLQIPLSAPYRIVGQVLVAPTDFASQTAPYIPTVTLLPYCDGDVSDLEGQRFTDVARDARADDTSLKSSVLIMGADHNFFNTEWTPGLSAAPSDDDWTGSPTALCGTRTAGRLTAGEQRAVGGTYIAGAAQLFTGHGAAASLLPMFDGSPVRVASAGRAVVYSSALGGDSAVRRPGRDAVLALADGAQSRFCTGSTSFDFRPDLCGSQRDGDIAPHWTTLDDGPVPARRFWQLEWSQRHQSGGLSLTRPLDLRSRSLDLRTIVDYRIGDVAITVRITDSAGRSAVLTPQGGEVVEALPASPSGSWDQTAKLWAQTVRLDPTPAAGEVDLSRVTRVDVIGDSRRGRLWIADLASRGTSLPTVPDERAPALSIGTRTVREGNRDGVTVVDVPYRLSRPMDTAGQFRVHTTTEDERAGAVTENLTVDLAAGQQAGTIPVGYRADRLDSPARLTTTISAWATSGIATDAWVGSLVVLDDDPTPTVRLTPVRRTIREGESAQWRVTLSSPVGYGADVEATCVTGPGRQLTGADVPKAWLAEHATRPGTSRTLAALGVVLGDWLPAGQRSLVFSIPVREDGVAEPQETVTLRVRVLGRVLTSTITVAASH